MILLDTNILLYAAGEDHRHRQPSLALLERIARGEVIAAVDAEVLQEILHRYRSIRRWEQGRRVYDLTRRIVLEVLPVTGAIMDEARRILDRHDGLMARDAVHAAVCRKAKAQAICSFDTDLDRIEGVRRIEPQNV